MKIFIKLMSLIVLSMASIKAAAANPFDALELEIRSIFIGDDNNYRAEDFNPLMAENRFQQLVDEFKEYCKVECAPRAHENPVASPIASVNGHRVITQAMLYELLIRSLGFMFLKFEDEVADGTIQEDRLADYNVARGLWVDQLEALEVAADATGEIAIDFDAEA